MGDRIGHSGVNRNNGFILDLYGANAGNSNIAYNNDFNFSGMGNYGNTRGGGDEETPGFTAKDGINTALGAYNLYLAKKGLNLSQENFDFRKKATAKNYNAAAQSYNTQLADLYAGRLGGSGQFNRGTAEGRNELAAAVEAKASKKYISPNF